MPPHHERIPTAMDDLVAFAGRDDIQALVHAALVHAQFETIHPFPDGNGPIRSAISNVLLRRRIPHGPARSQLGHRSGTPCCCTRQFRSDAVRT
ncbi:MAG: Fic family protein [Cryobacterium sp.]|nr:Fic family protein [Cryobacterium sp.]